MTQTWMVTGASGHLGSSAIEHLLGLNAGRIIAGTRKPEQLSSLAERGVTVRKVDFDEPETLKAAFEGVDRLLIISTTAPNTATQHRAAIDAAVSAGVKHVVYTSITNPTAHEGFLHAHIETEQMLADSPLSWTVLRNNIYTEYIFQLQDFAQAIATGELISAGNGAVGYVTRDDCARAAAAALASPDTSNRIYDISGATTVTHTDLAAIASEVSGKPVRHVAVTAEKLTEILTASGTPAQWIPGLVGVQVQMAAGVMAVASNAVEVLTGSAPQSVRDYFAQHRDQLIGTVKADSFMA